MERDRPNSGLERHQGRRPCRRTPEAPDREVVMRNQQEKKRISATAKKTRYGPLPSAPPARLFCDKSSMQLFERTYSRNVRQFDDDLKLRFGEGILATTWLRDGSGLRNTAPALSAKD